MGTDMTMINSSSGYAQKVDLKDPIFVLPKNLAKIENLPEEEHESTVSVVVMDNSRNSN